MAIIDTINRVLREFKRYTGDGLAGEPTGASLPIGDPSSGVHNPKKSELRALFAETAEHGKGRRSKSGLRPPAGISRAALGWPIVFRRYAT